MSSSSIQQKMMKVIMLTSGIVLVMTCAAFFVYEYISAHETIRRHTTTLGQIVAANSTVALTFDNHEEASKILNALRAEKNIKAAALYDENGDLFAKYPADLPVFYLPPKPRNAGYHFRGSFLEGFEYVEQNGIKVGTIFLRSDMSDMYQRFLLYGIIATLFIIISFVFAWFISRQLQRSISYPILQLADIARIVSDKQNYSVRAVNRSNDEVGTLTEALNHMLTRIEIQNAQITALNQNLEQKVAVRTRELEKSNEQLLQQTEFSEKILDSSVDLIAVFDRDLKFVTVNRKAEVVYNMSRTEMAGKKLYDVFPQTKTSGMVDDVRNAFKGEMTRHVNYVSGVTNRRYENFYIPLKDKNDQVFQVLVVAHDITDIMEANEKLKTLNAELEKSNRELEQFAYVASHDLQEPLRKIQTFSELGERNMKNDELLTKYLGKVRGAAHRMTELIKAVLNYSRITRSVDDFEAVDLNLILQSIYVDLELLIEEKNVTILHDGLPVIKGSPLQLHQLFFNLITNSIKFCEQTPAINISCSMISGKDIPVNGVLKEKNYVLITFRDNGIGFDPQFGDKAFSIFQRLHADRNYAGTGIGLAVCKRIVDNHNGMITVDSEPGKGTTFYIYLPVTIADADQLTKISSTNTIAL